ncbi:substrate-binding domain-containing protein [Dactylosporangium roseum]|uniref:Substrate-binding domain-containing protein n=1 Tax=Dactylosporangium roseum TaxID=47989 RepID=A0ABY5Z5F1_9ACTN|nr:substrate-binding and VWA domain-containing protein [Dactylosporangium roseum]UWZ36796.1 substrate-binding domain-containing protein [Dactylosporangium roseum]
MRGRHRAADLRSNGFVALAAGMILPLVAIGAVYGGYRAMSTSGCSGTVRLSVATSPEIAPAIKDAAARWLKTEPRVDNECVAVDVTPVASAEVAAAIAGEHGVDIPSLGQADGKTQVPQVWIPDSSMWLQRMRAAREDLVPQATPSLARSPIVLAVPEPTAKSLGWLENKLSWKQVLQQIVGDTRITPGIVDPNRDAVGVSTLVAMASVRDQFGPEGDSLTVGAVKSLMAGKSEQSSGLIARFPRDADPRTLSTAVTLAPLSEQALHAYNAGGPAVPLIAVYPDPAPIALDFPFTAMPRLSPNRAAAAEQLRSVLTGSEFRNLLAAHHLRANDGSVGAGMTLGPSAASGGGVTPVPDPAVINKALQMWVEITQPSRMLAVVDTSSAMKASVPSAGGLTKGQVAVQAAQGGLDLFPDSWSVGLWSFSAGHHELVPIGPLSTQRDQLRGAIAGLKPDTKAGSGLYDTIFAAYETVQQGWDPGRGNSVVVITGGRNNNPGGISLDSLVSSLQKVEKPNQPVQIIIIGVGSEVNQAELQKIVDATGGAVFIAPDPSKIGEIFMRALALDDGR